mgnify:FL=1
MKIENLSVYLSGEIHTDWRDILIKDIKSNNLPIKFYSPITDHAKSDDCGAIILGKEEKKFWNDHKGASVNSLRNTFLIKKSDIVIIKFGEKYKQWNAAFDAGISIGLNKQIITIHDESLDHALKEIDASANAVCRNNIQAINVLKYITTGDL